MDYLWREIAVWCSEEYSSCYKAPSSRMDEALGERVHSEPLSMYVVVPSVILGLLRCCNSMEMSLLLSAPVIRDGGTGRNSLIQL